MNTKKNNNIVVGVGQLLYDHIFLGSDVEMIYKFSRGGGTVGNILAHLSAFGIPNVLLGVVGTNNEFGKRALKETLLLGTDVSYVKSLENKDTMAIFQKSYIGTQENFVQHEFSTRCLVCNGKYDWQTSPQEKDYFAQIQKSFSWENVCLTFTDKITKPRMELFHAAKKTNNDIVTLVDLGHIGHLRFLKADQIVRLLKGVDIIFITERVAKYLQKRFQYGTLDAFFSRFIKIIPTLNVIFYTQGKDGLTIFWETNNYVQKKCVAAPDIKGRLFTEGSGDALAASVIYQLYIYDQCANESPVEWSEIINRALKHLRPTLTEIGARAGIPLPEALVNEDRLAKYKGKTVTEIQKATKKLVICPFCGQTNFQRIEKDEIIRRIKRTKSNANFQKAISLSSTMIFEHGQTFAAVGTGGSFAPAAFFTQVLLRHGKYASLYLPYQFLDFGISVDWLVIFSYSGRTRDYDAVIKHARNLGVKRIALITGNPTPSLRKLLNENDLVINYETLPNLERGFLTFSGVLLPSTLFAMALFPEDITHDYVEFLLNRSQKFKKEDISQVILSIKKNHVLEVFWDSGAFPAFLDIESKLTESGISAVLGHEHKNFSHGRFMLSLNKKIGNAFPKLFIQSQFNMYSDFLLEKIKEGSDTPIIVIKSDESGVKGMLDVLYRIDYLYFLLAKKFYGKKTDVTKPKHIPKVGLELYRFRSVK